MIPGNTLPLLLGGAQSAPDYRIARGLRFNSADSAFLSRTAGTAGNRKTWTWSGWVKNNCVSGLNYPVTMIAAQSGAGTAITDFFWVGMNSSFQVEIGNGAGTVFLRTNAIFSDPSAWYHFVCVFDSTQAGAANRFKLYVNGAEITSFAVDSRSSISLNVDAAINNNIPHTIGRNFTSFYSACYFADIHFVAGQALTPSSFGETDIATGQWQPKTYAGTFGTGGFHLKFVDNSAATSSTLGKDYSGNNNNWTPNNLSVAPGAGNDSVADAPTSSGIDLPSGGVVNGNYCVFNPFDKGLSISVSNGNLQWSEAAGNFHSVRGTLPLIGGKWYWEVSLVTGGPSSYMVGIASNNADLNTQFSTSSQGWAYYGSGGSKINSGTSSAYGASFTAGDNIGIAYDADAGALYFYKNGVAQNGGVAAFTGITGGPYFPALALRSGSITVNFGQQPFLYQTAGVNRPSADYKAVCDTNLPAPAITKPTTAMDVKLYTGNGSSQTIATEFEPGFVWMKARSSNIDHILQDSSRGFSSSTKLSSSLTNSEINLSGSSSTITSATASGFTVSGFDSYLNANGSSYVAWAWKSSSTGVTNNSGTVSSVVRANPATGISVVTFSNPGISHTVGHGLGVAPSLIFYKNRVALTNWSVYHSSRGATGALFLNRPDAFTASSSYWNNTTPTSSVFAMGAGLTSGSAVAYCFSEIAGYSSFGSYIGTGFGISLFVNLGFTPAVIIIKNSTFNSTDWYIFDRQRSPGNSAIQALFPNLSGPESPTAAGLDILSNGFKVRASDSNVNSTGSLYVYAAWAVNPFKYARAR